MYIYNALVPYGPFIRYSLSKFTIRPCSNFNETGRLRQRKKLKESLIAKVSF